MEIRPHRRIILPLDFSDWGQAVDVASDLHQHIGVIKIGLQLFTAVGPDVLKTGVSLGLDTFLDLKLHDIPNTVSKAVALAADYGVQYMTIHACGGPAMMEAAAKAAPKDMTLLAVTVLTSLSMDDLDKTGHKGTVEEITLQRAKLAKECGISGLVCSPLEVKKLREELGPEVTLVVPGVRPKWAQNQDQKRVATPKQAMEDGANLLVIGRPITQADDPARACRDIAEEIRPFT